jgi:hypothetical protein
MHYTQSRLQEKEAKTGFIWRNVAKFIDLIDREGVRPTNTNMVQMKKAVDIFGAMRYYGSDVITSHLFVEGSRALEGDMTMRKAIEDSVELSQDIITCLNLEFGSLLVIMDFLISLCRRICRIKSPKSSGRSRLTKPCGKQSQSSNELYGGTVIRDFGFKHFVATRKAFETGQISSSTNDPVAAKLAQNAVEGDVKASMADQSGDTGIRYEVKDVSGSGPGIYYLNEGCASECMDQYLAGLETISDTLCYVLHLLSIEANADIQHRLRIECKALDLPPASHTPLTLNQAKAVQNAPYLDAVLKETLRRYPANTLMFQRVVPPGGRFLDAHFVSESTQVYSSPILVNFDKSVFEPHALHPVVEWLPERWLHDDSSEMDRRLWTFGSGAR